MPSLSVSCIGCPMPVVEVLRSVLHANGKGKLCDPNDPNATALVYCDTEEQWATLGALVSAEQSVVAMITRLDVDEYARAIAQGASGVVMLDTTGEMMVAVIEAAQHHEVVLPNFAARSLAAMWLGSPLAVKVTEYEVTLLNSLSSGSRIVDLAEDFAYSDRTIRRQLQSLYLKLGASSRAEAILNASRARLI